MNVTRLIIDISLVIFFICFVFSLVYFFNGSLEMFPTSEQNEKARIFNLVMSLIFAAIEIILVVLRMKLKRKHKWSDYFKKND